MTVLHKVCHGLQVCPKLALERQCFRTTPGTSLGCRTGTVSPLGNIRGGPCSRGWTQCQHFCLIALAAKGQAGDVAQWVQVPTPRPEIHVVEGEQWPLQVVLWPGCMHHGLCPAPHPQINTKVPKQNKETVKADFYASLQTVPLNKKKRTLNPLSLSCQFFHTVKMKSWLANSHSVKQPLGLPSAWKCTFI